MALGLGRLKLPWRTADSHADDPYWDFFINTPAADLANSVPDIIRQAAEGNIFPTKADIHTPDITTTHVKEMARYLGADMVGVAGLGPDESGGLPFAVVCAFRTDHDPRVAKGIGGQVPVQNASFVTFVLSAWIRELGFRASVVRAHDTERLAVRAKLGTLDRDGKLTTPQYGTGVYVADVIGTDLPLAP